LAGTTQLAGDESPPRLHNFRNRYWKPARINAGIVPLRRVYDLCHTLATFALRVGISTFDLSRYMEASLTVIDRHYGHLAHDGREHAIRLLDGYADIRAADVPAMDVRRTPQSSTSPLPTTEPAPKREETESPLTDSNRRPPLNHPTHAAFAAPVRVSIPRETPLVAASSIGVRPSCDLAPPFSRVSLRGGRLRAAIRRSRSSGRLTRLMPLADGFVSARVSRFSPARAQAKCSRRYTR